MQTVIATAPGKAVLSGEYAVLHGAAAIAAAVARRARVTISESAGDCHVISAPGYLPGKWSFTVDGNKNFDWQELLPDPSAFALVQAIWNALDNAEWPPLSIEIDSREFCDAKSGLKLGLGSSAAVAVALTAALKGCCDLDCYVFATASLAHHLFQHLRGSGIDVAASHEGGVILYRHTVGKPHSHDMRENSQRRSVRRSTKKLGWPDGLHYRFLWSGHPADTKDMLSDLGDGDAGDEKNDALTVLCDRAEFVADAWSSGDSQKILEAYPDYLDALEGFSAAHDLGIFAAGHEELARAATSRNVVYKPCGAGGGDIGIVLGACEHDVDEFCELARKQKFSALDLAIDEQGVLFAE